MVRQNLLKALKIKKTRVQQLSWMFGTRFAQSSISPTKAFALISRSTAFISPKKNRSDDQFTEKVSRTISLHFELKK